MQNKRDVPVVRLFSAFLFVFALYLCWVPSFSSLQKATGHVSAAGTTITRFNATFTLDNGQVLKCAGKGWWIFGSQICPAIDLKKAHDTQEAVIFFYSDEKVWGAESAVDHRKIIDYTSIRNSRWGVMGLITFVFLGMFFFAPALISPGYDKN